MKVNKKSPSATKAKSKPAPMNKGPGAKMGPKSGKKGAMKSRCG